LKESKIKLSDSEQVQIDLSFIEEELQLVNQRIDFEESLLNSVVAIQNILNVCVAQAGVSANDIDLVILTGGGTAIPLIQAITQQIFPHAEISDGNRLSSVGFGLACDAKRVYLNA